MQACAFVQSERSFLSPLSIDFKNGLVPNDKPPLEMVLELQNSGKSPATVEELWVVITHGPLDPQPPQTRGDRFEFPAVPPGGKAKRTLRFISGWSEQTIAEMKSGARKLFIFGSFTHHDTYSAWWRRVLGSNVTGFCYELVPQTTEPGYSFEICRQQAYVYSR